ncbi:hypothetical protein L5515_002204 [Caenorhabditis briggsae]|uniref:Uncharacterized protein n=1 Tax=Caenorhabditis briggsae TaxID=6238 RepID=A0AAE9E7S7_CAEBR|nr:hypothetical protein L5515_002204 [Caenorhabditis briggsae]
MHGAGRAEYFIALAMGIHNLDKAVEPSIFDIVKSIREQRPRAVESLTQYVSLYTTLFSYIKKRWKAVMDCDEPTCKKTAKLMAAFTKELDAEFHATVVATKK